MNQIKGQEELYGRPLYLTKDAELPVQKLMESAILLSDNNSSYSNNYDSKEKFLAYLFSYFEVLRPI